MNDLNSNSITLYYISFILFCSFSGQAISSKALLLITIQLNIPESTVNIFINSDRIVLATMILKELQQTFSLIS